MVMLSTQVSELDLDDFDGQLTQTVVLSNISWQTYQAMLTEMGDHRATRATYDKGVQRQTQGENPGHSIGARLG
ncbi:MAG: hypothetical protein WA885_12930 [Phormidesmis sp.]